MTCFSFSLGSGISIAVQGDDLLVTAVRARFQTFSILGECRIVGYRSRPVKEWARQYSDFLREVRLSHVAAVVVLPRSWTTVRVLNLPHLGRADLASAIALQMDSLHPYAEDDVVQGWCRLPGSSQVLAAIASRAEFNGLLASFREARIQVSSCTVSAAAIYSAIRLTAKPVAQNFAAVEKDGVLTEIYAETGTRYLYSISLKSPPEKFAQLLRSELRLDPHYELLPLAACLPSAEGAFSSSIGFAAALHSVSLLPPVALNLLAKADRVSNSRLRYLPTAALAALLVLCAIVYRIDAGIEQRNYRTQLEALVAQVQPRALQVRALQRETAAAAARISQIDSFRRQSASDIQALSELSRALAAPAYLTTLDLNRSAVAMAGQASSASGLLKQIDNSSQFKNSAFVGDIAGGPDGESFRLKAERRVAP